MSSRERVSASSAIQTYTGRVLDPIHPDPAQIDPLDIAHALSLQCRFSGHVKVFYSVAEHSCRAAEWLGARGETWETQLWGLLHDASEAYLVDLPSPVKNDHFIGDRYRKIERRLMRAICERFDLPLEQPEAVTTIDRRLLATERRDLLDAGARVSLELRSLWEPWLAGVPKLRDTISPRSSQEAEEVFLWVMQDLEAKRRSST